jgi:hypothetical protein
MSPRVSARIARNFQRNLDNIRAYLDETAASGAFDALLDALFDTVIPTIEASPQIGFDFLARRPASFEGVPRVKALRARLGKGASIREYITGDYLILYVLQDGQIVLLAIKHHLQLSFDLRGHWSP